MAMKLRRTDSTMNSIALIAGIAVGAALGVLFAPKNIKAVRKRLTNDLKGLVGLAETVAADSKDHAIPDLRANIKEKADHLTGPDAVDTTKTTLKQTGPKSRQLPVEE